MLYTLLLLTECSKIRYKKDQILEADLLIYLENHLKHRLCGLSLSMPSLATWNSMTWKSNWNDGSVCSSPDQSLLPCPPQLVVFEYKMRTQAEASPGPFRSCPGFSPLWHLLSSALIAVRVFVLERFLQHSEPRTAPTALFTLCGCLTQGSDIFALGKP